MSQTKQIWTILLAACLFSQALIAPVATAPFPESPKELEARQVPLTPSQFSLAATRFIVLLPFLPLLMFVPGMTGVLMPMFLALQDRLQTIAPNLNVSIFGIRPNNNNNAGVGSVSNQGVTVSAATTEAPSSTTPANTYYRFKRSLWKPKLPTKEITEGFKEVKNFLSMADGIFNLVTSSQPDCRRQAVCRLHHALDPSLGKILGNVFEVLKLESKVEKLEVSDTTRSIIKDALRAANTGLFRQDCSSVYSRCSVVFSSRKP